MTALEETTGRPVVWATAQYLDHVRVGATMDIDVQPTDWYLLDIEISAIRNGFGHGQLRIWDHGGHLQAIASQSVVVRDRR